MANDSISILVATASRELARDLRSRLEREGHLVEVVDSGAATLVSAKDFRDLIILDLDLPGMDGLSVLEELRNAGRTAPVVLLKRADEQAHVVQRGFDLGASGYLNKAALDSQLSSVVDLFRQVAPHENERRRVNRATLVRLDACPYSAGGDFRNCSAFVPIEIVTGDGQASTRTSCSHLRVGTADGWGLYPRCALGDVAARERYFADLIC